MLKGNRKYKFQIAKIKSTKNQPMKIIQVVNRG